MDNTYNVEINISNSVGVDIFDNITISIVRKMDRIISFEQRLGIARNIGNRVGGRDIARNVRRYQELNHFL